MIENKHIPLINVLSKMKPEDFKTILDVLPDEATEIICECVKFKIWVHKSPLE